MNSKTYNTAGSCTNCARRDFIHGLFAATAMGGLAAKADFRDFLAALPAPTPAGAIPDKTGAVKVRLVFAAFDEVQKRKTWPYIGFDFRPVMKNVTDALNAAIKGVAFVPGMASDVNNAKKIGYKVVYES